MMTLEIVYAVAGAYVGPATTDAARIHRVYPDCGSAATRCPVAYRDRELVRVDLCAACFRVEVARDR
jgi:hypothetical protein